MVIEDLVEAFTCAYGSEKPVLTYCRGKETILGRDQHLGIAGPNPINNDSIFIELISGDDCVGMNVPMSILANHLRVAGWTVIPPVAR